MRVPPLITDKMKKAFRKKAFDGWCPKWSFLSSKLESLLDLAPGQFGWLLRIHRASPSTSLDKKSMKFFSYFQIY